MMFEIASSLALMVQGGVARGQHAQDLMLRLRCEKLKIVYSSINYCKLCITYRASRKTDRRIVGLGYPLG